MAASENLLQQTKCEVVDLQGQIDKINAIGVIDLTTKASLKKTETYVKESFEELKTFQWTLYLDFPPSLLI